MREIKHWTIYLNANSTRFTLFDFSKVYNLDNKFIYRFNKYYRNIRALSKAIEENKEIIDDSTKSDNEKLKAERALSKSKERLLELLPEEARERVRASNYSKEAIERELNILIHCKKKLHFLKTSYKPLHSFKENLTKICQYSLPFSDIWYNNDVLRILQILWNKSRKGK